MAIIATKRTMTTASNTDIMEARMATEVFLSCPMVGEEVGTEEVGKTLLFLSCPMVGEKVGIEEVGKTIATIVTSVLVKDDNNVEIEL